MKRLILIKQSPAIQLGHLYEHIFCAHVDTFLYEHHLFPKLDYSLDGRTYHGGVIYIDVELYTKAATTLASEIATLAIELNEMTISIAVSQLLAEKEEPFSGLGYDKVKQALKELHELPWQNIDDVTLVDLKGVRRRANPFYITEGKPLRARKLTTGILLDATFAASHRELLPLFRQLAWLINASLQETLADTYGYFSFEDKYKNTKEKIGLFNIFKVAFDQNAHEELADALATCIEVVYDLQQYNAFMQYMDELRRLSYYNHPNLAPNLERNYEDTLIFIGPKGWQQIATNENYELLFKHMSIEVKFGREKTSQALVS